ncbi:type III-B CRISPR module RAMP protein Cmr4 [Sulfurisphaera ohwakuensis]|uniref:CRISPR-associated protein Cmr4 n=1 Tax=Sulfurisphaera ohwakuensis TaxID=69656 RepID=A0A650CK68_SULOH|nr:type III-B CRISPR module RAMP protein Cmr4 [Sulfurisphaera ohwakuensis]MBB5254877.1 CRISPR-associated protein Cmr4 [Sulfurisphaera ohwakuensis]QGR18274.1 type III-B CRISPR module RAMP protein Cmr4 [Sulfurisphaera ohwakuensis]
MSKTYLVLAYAITPVHVGMGRAPGVVDLPFQRDSIGYPIVYGSSFKGVLKSTLMGKNDKLAKCIFGAEPDEDEKYMGRFIITDLIPVFYPIASLDGYIYVSTDYLLRKTLDILSIFKDTSAMKIENIYTITNHGEEIGILLGKLKSSYTLTLSDSVKKLGSLIKDKVYVFSDDVGLQVVESALVRVTRNVLDDNTKKSQNLWTEEYLPQGTVFIGAIIDAERTNELCVGIKDIDKEFREKLDNAAIFLGGKETIGKGLVKIKVI